MPKWLQRACDKDVGLQLDLEDERRLTSALQGEREGEFEERDERLTRRILDSLGASSQLVTESSPWKEIILGVAACVAIALAFQWGRDVTSAPSEGLVQETDGMSGDFGQVFSLAESEWKNPLDEEMENVLSDAQGAIDFLAESFLPSSVRPSKTPKG